MTQMKAKVVPKSEMEFCLIENERRVCEKSDRVHWHIVLFKSLGKAWHPSLRAARKATCRTHSPEIVGDKRSRRLSTIKQLPRTSLSPVTAAKARRLAEFQPSEPIRVSCEAREWGGY
jgi:hypothetical protein